jgi:hypothetical protein
MLSILATQNPRRQKPKSDARTMILAKHRVFTPVAEVGATRVETRQSLPTRSDRDAAEYAASAEPAHRKSIFARMMEALHFSRQCDARRLIRRFHYLIADTESRSNRRP